MFMLEKQSGQQVAGFSILAFLPSANFQKARCSVAMQLEMKLFCHTSQFLQATMKANTTKTAWAPYYLSGRTPLILILKIGETRVLLASSLLQFVVEDWYPIQKWITPKDYQNAELARIPFNFAIVKLARPIKVSEYSIPVCLPTDPSYFTHAQPCFMPNTHYNVLTSYGNAHIMILQPFAQCRQHSKKLLPERHFCANFLMPFAHNNKDMTANMLLEGAPLLCIKDNLIYQLGILDWIKTSNYQDAQYPVAFFSATFNITPIVNEVTKENFISPHIVTENMKMYQIMWYS
ncbi:hypothetical protein T4B_13484 [Trichinella pseudospiralis]|uniref:Peptidase S1 domain-containing protein n=1 Tax=Trichinella pseudospiralis TaxID=6337 RepID=A0A0V1K441_TRIPS|nr:hypothetical protein T4B_13484 [Trichinella pseudospiralis]KRZ41981.1 hypothetical protein T4C_11056 [Trichinella pseudospiralis]